ncbi:MAG: N-acetyltransferase family protein [Halobacteriota archaeon]
MNHVTLDDGTTIELKVAHIEDYQNGGYEYLYSWLSQVDQFLAKRYRVADLVKNKEQWLRRLNTNEITLLGLHQDKIVGTATLIMNDPESRAAHVASFGVAVHPAFQRKSLGKLLIVALEQIALEQGIKKIEVNCYDGNAAAALYRCLNYVSEGRRLKKGRLDNGSYVDELLFYKFISPF